MNKIEKIEEISRRMKNNGFNAISTLRQWTLEENTRTMASIQRLKSELKADNEFLDMLNEFTGFEADME